MRPEASFIRRVHKAIKRDPIHREKTEAGNGTPDFYYEALCSTLRVEYKVHPNGLSKKQSDWLERAWSNGIPAWVVTWYPRQKQVGIFIGPGNAGEKVSFLVYIKVLRKQLGLS